MAKQWSQMIDILRSTLVQQDPDVRNKILVCACEFDERGQAVRGKVELQSRESDPAPKSPIILPFGRG